MNKENMTQTQTVEEATQKVIDILMESLDAVSDHMQVLINVINEAKTLPVNPENSPIYRIIQSQRQAAVEEYKASLWKPIEEAPETRNGESILIGRLPDKYDEEDQGAVELVPAGCWLSDFLEGREEFTLYQPLPALPPDIINKAKGE